MTAESAATGFVWLYLVLVTAFVRSLVVTPPEACGTPAGAAFIALLLLGCVVAVIVRRDSRLAVAGKLWPPLKWLRDLPAAFGILMLLATVGFAIVFD